MHTDSIPAQVFIHQACSEGPDPRASSAPSMSDAPHFYITYCYEEGSPIHGQEF